MSSDPHQEDSDFAKRMESTGGDTLSIANKSVGQRRVRQHGLEIDRISQLSNDILLEIFSFLPFEYWVLMSVVSNRFKDLWTYAPVLNFDEQEMAVNPFRDGIAHALSGVEALRIRFTGFVDRAIRLHSGFTIVAFRLAFDCYHPSRDVSMIDNWVAFSLTRNIEILQLNFDKSASFNYYTSHGLRVSRRTNTIPLYALPCQPFAPKILTTMTLHCCEFQASNLGRFESLKFLYLINVGLEDNKLTQLLSKFPVLNNLYLESCASGEEFFVSEEVLTIKFLYIINCFRTTWLLFPVDITAPQLLSFTFRGLYLQHFSMKETDDLRIVQIDITFPIADRFQGNLLASLLNFVPNCSYLDLSSWCIQVLSTRQSSPWEYLLQLWSITNLSLYVNVIKEEFPGINCLLRSCSKLETLNMNINIVDEPERGSVIWAGFTPNVFNFEEDGYWESQDLPIICLRHSLKTIHIYGFTGRTKEVEILKFLLRKAMVLETLYIHRPNGEPVNPVSNEDWVTKITNIYANHIENANEFASGDVRVVLVS